MKPMQVRIDGEEVIPNSTRVVVTYVEPDIADRLGPTVEVVLHLETGERTFPEISAEAVRQTEELFKSILELT